MAGTMAFIEFWPSGTLLRTTDSSGRRLPQPLPVDRLAVRRFANFRQRAHSPEVSSAFGFPLGSRQTALRGLPAGPVNVSILKIIHTSLKTEANETNHGDTDVDIVDAKEC